MLFWKSKCTNCGKCRSLCRYELNDCELCGKCTVYCPAHAREISGKMYTVSEVVKEVAMDKIFYDYSGGGVTFSGGECMLQIDFLEKLLCECHKLGINTAVDTAGNVPWEYFERIIPYTDIFLYDVKCISDDLHIKGTGVSNKRILDNLKRLSDSFEGDIIIRVPIIPTFNDDIEELEKMADFLKCINCKDIDILPYHVMGNGKYDALGKESCVYPTPSEESIENIKKILKK
jgi:pyruvate formate lyase activating enzyme